MVPRKYGEMHIDKKGRFYVIRKSDNKKIFFMKLSDLPILLKKKNPV